MSVLDLAAGVLLAGGLVLLCIGLRGRIVCTGALFCRRCGYEVPDSAASCSECGARLVPSSRVLSFAMMHPVLARVMYPTVDGRRLRRRGALGFGAALVCIGVLHAGLRAGPLASSLDPMRLTPTPTLLERVATSASAGRAAPAMNELRRRAAAGRMTTLQRDRLRLLELRVRQLEYEMLEPRQLLAGLDATRDARDARLMILALETIGGEGGLTAAQRSRLGALRREWFREDVPLASADARSPGAPAGTPPRVGTSTPRRRPAAPAPRAVDALLASADQRPAAARALATGRRSDRTDSSRGPEPMDATITTSSSTIALGDDILLPSLDEPRIGRKTPDAVETAMRSHSMRAPRSSSAPVHSGLGGLTRPDRQTGARSTMPTRIRPARTIGASLATPGRPLASRVSQSPIRSTSVAHGRRHVPQRHESRAVGGSKVR